MALDPQQQFEIDMENVRHTNQMTAEQRRARLEVVRLAKETLIENARYKPTEEAGVTAVEITVFADELNTYVNG
jgi:hypothetical protein